VLLIDEIDRADEHLEALMLEVLAEFQVTIPELGTMAARSTPYVVITSNSTRDVSEALKRRCLHLSLRYPSADRELEILRVKVPAIEEQLLAQVVELVRAVRELDLRKAPSISEALDWARALVLLNVASLDRRVIEETISLIIKHDKDVDRVQEQLPQLLGLAGAPAHEHAHAGADHHYHDDHRHHHHSSPEQQAYNRNAEGYFGAVRPPS
jgi:MoxR-like ATPase